jgi:carboxymethylenebutenolidase
LTDVLVPTPLGSMPAYLARPPGVGPWPGVVVIHDAFGPGDNLRRHADWLADNGFLAIAPDLLHWGSKLTCLRAIMKDITKRQGRSFDDIEASRLWLKQQPWCSDRVGVIGFCMGGAFAMLLAPKGGYEAAAPNYGKVPEDADSYFSGSCPIVGSFGRRDPTLRGAAAKLERALVQNSVEHDVKEYKSASHGFMDDHKGDPLPFPVVVLKTVLNIGYDGPSATDAKARICAFFDRHLRDADTLPAIPS